MRNQKLQKNINRTKNRNNNPSKVAFIIYVIAEWLVPFGRKSKIHECSDVVQTQTDSARTLC